MCALLATSCASAQPEPVERVVERVRAPAPALPRVCPDAARPRAVPLAGAERALVIFTSDWCNACDRMLEALTAARSELASRNVSVTHVVTQSDGSCVRAGRVGRAAPFAYASIDADTERRWGVRSTPTIWVLGPEQREALVYIEGELSMPELLRLLGED